MGFFDNFIGQAVTLIVVVAVAFWLLHQKSLLLKLIGGIFCLFGLVQLLRSPSVIGAIAIVALIYLVFLALKSAKKAKDKKKAAAAPFCAKCGHAAHSASCPVCGCRN